MKTQSNIRAAVLAALALLATRLSGQVPATYTWTIPGTVNASGLNGTRFVSDLAVTNPGTAPAIAVLTLVPANGTSQSLMLLNPGQTVVTRNVLEGLWGASGAAATLVNASAPLLIRARTYNTAASGTYGVALPVVPNDRFIFTGDSADTLWISQSADGAAGYRTNVAVVFPDVDGGDATVTVYDANGSALGTQAYSLASAGFQQFGVGSFAGAVAAGRAKLTVMRGRAAGYAVVVDNVTGDSSLFSFEDLPVGPQDVLVNGVARSNGRNATFFRTDARVYNPTSSAAQVTVAYHANQSANPSPQAATFAVPARKILDVVDVLSTLLSLPVGSAGALRFTSAAPVAILCRTSNVDPSGANPGTFGAQQKPNPILSFLSSADAGAVVTGIRQNASFRTNVGFAAGADGAAYSLALKNAGGAQVGSAQGSLGAWGWTQPNVQDLFPGVTVPDDATLQVTMTSGTLDVFDSSIDNASGDPVVTPIMPLPLAIASSATIGSSGGSIQSADGKLTLKIPAGALTAPTPISVTSATSTAPNAVGPSYTISPSGLAFAKPSLVVFAYDRGDVNGRTAAALVPAFQSGANWYSMPGWATDTRARTASAVFPPASSASGKATRHAQAETPSTVTLSSDFTIQGPQVVPPGGHSASYVLVRLKPVPNSPGVSTDLGFASVPDSGVSWTVDAGSIDGRGVSTALFTSPPCPPPSGTATIETTYRGEAASLVVNIFPLDWNLKIEEDVDDFCLLGTLHFVGYHAADNVDQDFRIDPDTSAVVPGAMHHPGYTGQAPWVTPPAACDLLGNACGCTFLVTVEPPGLSLDILEGRALMGYLTFRAQYQHIGVPGFEVRCSGPTPCQAVIHQSDAPGAQERINIPYGYIPYRGAVSNPNKKPSSNQIVTDVFTTKPKDLSCP